LRLTETKRIEPRQSRTIMADKLSEEVKAFLRQMFDEIDTDRSGSIDAKELKAIIEKTEGCDASDEAIQKEMASMDINGDGKITFDEMCTVIAAALGK
jgi:calcium-dependent protein kinase